MLCSRRSEQEASLCLASSILQRQCSCEQRTPLRSSAKSRTAYVVAAVIESLVNERQANETIY